MRVGETFTQHAVVWRRAAFLALLCIALAAITASADLHVALLEVMVASRELIVRHPVLGALLFVLLAAVSAMFFFFSSAILVPVAVYVWGELLTMLMLWLGWTLGGGVAYGIARYFGRPVVRWLTVDRPLRRVERRIRPDTPFKYIFLFQLGLPSEIPGYVLGLVKYPFGKFLLARRARRAAIHGRDNLPGGRHRQRQQRSRAGGGPGNCRAECRRLLFPAPAHAQAAHVRQLRNAFRA